MYRSRFLVFLLLTFFFGCSDSSETPIPPADSGPLDSRIDDGGVVIDSGRQDSSVNTDSGTDDGGSDTGIESDSHMPDSGTPNGIVRGGVRLGASPRDVCPSGFQTTAPGNGRHRNFRVSGVGGSEMREFYVSLPNASFTGPRPLFIAFNGTGGNGSFVRVADEMVNRGFIAIGPSSETYGKFYPWWDSMRTPDTAAQRNPDVEFFHQLLECATAHYEVDIERIFVGGFSAGGGFSNAILRRYSKVLAGGLVGSGVFDLTEPTPEQALDPMFVIVYFGGLRDQFGPLNGVLPGPFPFAEQAARASQFYEADPNVAQTLCSSDRGHSWPSGLETYFAEEFLAHPKGSALDDSVATPSPSRTYTCSADPISVSYPNRPPACGRGSAAVCQAFCQATSDCVSRNISIGTTLRPRLEQLGMTGPDTCGNCAEVCSNLVGNDSNVLSCISSRANSCGPGLDGFLPYRDAVQECCAGREGTGVCANLCELFTTGNVLGEAFFPNC